MKRKKEFVGRGTEYVRRETAILKAALGGKCAWPSCGTTENLEFDHINGRDYDPNKLSSTARIARYKQEFLNGELRLLCERHNKEARVKNDNGKFVRTEDRDEVQRTEPLKYDPREVF